MAARGAWLCEQLEARGIAVRGAGMMLGAVVPDAPGVARALLERGWLTLPAGEPEDPGSAVPGGVVLGLTPPLVITRAQLEGFLAALDAVLA